MVSEMADNDALFLGTQGLTLLLAVGEVGSIGWRLNVGVWFERGDTSNTWTTYSLQLGYQATPFRCGN